jgi:hypothetical protein
MVCFDLVTGIFPCTSKDCSINCERRWFKKDSLKQKNSGLVRHKFNTAAALPVNCYNQRVSTHCTLIRMKSRQRMNAWNSKSSRLLDMANESSKMQTVKCLFEAMAGDKHIIPLAEICTTWTSTIMDMPYFLNLSF